MTHIRVKQFETAAETIPVDLAGAEEKFGRPAPLEHDEVLALPAAASIPADLTAAEAKFGRDITPAVPVEIEGTSLKNKALAAAAALAITVALGMAGKSDLQDAERNTQPNPVTHSDSHR